MTTHSFLITALEPHAGIKKKRSVALLPGMDKAAPKAGLTVQTLRLPYHQDDIDKHTIA